MLTFYLSEKFSSKSYPHRLNLTLLKYYKNNIRDKFPEFTQNGNFLFVESFFKKMDDILQTRNKISSCSNGTPRSACRQFSISIPFLTVQVNILKIFCWYKPFSMISVCGDGFLNHLQCI